MKKIDIGCLQETYHDEDICLSESDGHLIFVRGKEEESQTEFNQTERKSKTQIKIQP
jgi:hypothetical protein